MSNLTESKFYHFSEFLWKIDTFIQYLDTLISFKCFIGSLNYLVELSKSFEALMNKALCNIEAWKGGIYWKC